jgi:phosphoribosylanthranilate isomerase
MIAAAGTSAIWVKICGTTNLPDALLAVDAGADAVGFVFGPSRRQVTAPQVAAITRALPAQVERIGLFVNETPARVAETVRDAGLTGVQLQGDESSQWVASFRRLHSGLLIRTVWASAGVDTLAGRVAHRQTDADAVLLDSGSAVARGGTGKAFDWTEVAAQLSRARQGVQIILAGGLDPGNVETAIATLRPWGVDVATGVEREPGKKDAGKVGAFVAAARRAASR